MNEQYLSVKESLGYKIIRQVSKIVFSIDLDTLPIVVGQLEDFGLQ